MLDNNVIKTLKLILENKKSRKLELENNQKMIEVYNRLTFIIENVLFDNARLKKIDLDSQDLKILGITDEEINELKIYKIFIKRQLILEPEQNESVNHIFTRLNEKLNILKNQTIFDSNEYMGICLEIMSIEGLISELQSSNILTGVEIVKLGRILKDNLDIEKAVDLISEYAYNMTSSYEDVEQMEQDNETQIIDNNDNNLSPEEEIKREIIETALDKDEVIELFKEFGIDFNKIVENDNNRYQSEICKYGDLDNIRAILEQFKKYDIDLVNNDLLNERSGAFAKIFTLSNAEIVSKILEFIVEDLKRNNDYNNIIYKINKAFSSYLAVPSVFVMGKVKYKGNNGRSKPGNNSFSGCFQHFEPLRNFFIEIGVKDFNKLLQTSSKLFTRGYKTIVTNYQKLLSYNVPTSKIIEDSSCLHDSDAIDIIDQFTEAGFKDYADNCLSIAQFNINDRRLIQMINAKRLGWNLIGVQGENAIFRKQNKGETVRLIRQDKMLSSLDGDNLMDEPMYKPSLEDVSINIDGVYGISEEVFENEYIRRLEETFKTSEYTYNFNEIIISRYKVLRYFSYLIKNGLGNFDNLKSIIFKNIIITKNEYDIVMSLLEEKVKKTGEQL